MGDLATLSSPVLQSVYEGKKVFITGDTGFKGSWLSIWLNLLGAEVFGYALDPKSEEDNFQVCKLDNKINHLTGDVTDKNKLTEYMKKVKPEIVFHLAAQPLVLESYLNPVETFKTNIMGTVNLLEAIRETDSVKCVVIITTDKVYKNNEWQWGYRENDALGGKDPYSASKAAVELVVDSYKHSFFNKNDSCKIVTVRAGNVIGGGDWAENRIVPDFIRAVKNKENLLLRNPWHTRPWQHVLEPLGGYLLLAAKMFETKNEYGGAWNFGPAADQEYCVKDLIERIIKSWGSGSFNYDNTNEKPFESSSLRLDISKAINSLKWKPVLNFDETVEFTVEGYKDEIESGNLFDKRAKQITSYMNIAKNKKIDWLFE